ncbi:FHA domain-containing protein [Nonomuraea sediminis]|uniref:FHA domain-containing protein n=1 Tax=Nonomuraea sediminis TaxID=2835864 RepID=UPI001BDBE66D|nr:FHA domain-containing protein [Nonomuraea sediminis]
MSESAPGPRFSRDLPPYRALVAVDLERFSTHPSSRLPVLSEAVPRVLEDAMRLAGLDWAQRRFPQDAGDGYVFGLPPELLPKVLHPFLPLLQRVLEEREPPRLRMRVAVHLGALPDSGGDALGDGVGKAMNDVHRLLDSAPVREALARTDPEVTLVAAIVSRRVYADVVEAGYTALRHGELTPVRAQVKHFDEEAWLYVPVPSGAALRGGLVEVPATADRDQDAGTAGGRGHGAVPVPRGELATARDERQLGVAKAVELLQARHLAVLPGGSRATGLRLLDGLSDETGVSVLEVVKRWQRPAVANLPLEPGCGYLLNLNSPATDHADSAFAEDLRTHVARLIDVGAYLVVTVRAELWRECRALLESYSIELTEPPGRREPRGTLFLRVHGPDGEGYPLSLGGRDEVTVGRPDQAVAHPDIAVDSDWVSRDHCRLRSREGRWWLERRGKNAPWLLRRGSAEPEPVEERAQLRHGDVIRLRVRPGDDGLPRHWSVEFHDPQHTETSPQEIQP